jgi:hypothetical protein
MNKKTTELMELIYNNDPYEVQPDGKIFVLQCYEPARLAKLCLEHGAYLGNVRGVNVFIINTNEDII